MIPFIGMFRIGKPTWTESRLVHIRGLGGGENREWLHSGYRKSFLLGDENILYLCTVQCGDHYYIQYWALEMWPVWRTGYIVLILLI